MRIPFRAKLKNSKGGKDAHWVFSVPMAYVKNGLLVPGQEYALEVEEAQPESVKKEEDGLAGIRTQPCVVLEIIGENPSDAEIMLIQEDELEDEQAGQ